MKNRKSNSLKFAIALTIVIHVLIYFLFNLVFLNYKSDSIDQHIIVEYKTFKKQKPKINYRIQKQVQSIKMSSKKNILFNNNPVKNYFAGTDSTNIEQIDSLVYSHKHSDSSKWFERFVLENPSIISLKLALTQNIKNKIIKETEAEIAVEGLKKYTNDYYNLKYPTPLSKFGDPGRGSMINIPVDDVINLFK